MKRGRIVQADALAQLGETDAVPVARNLLENSERAAEPLPADALPVLGVVVDVGPRWLDQSRNLGPDNRLLGGSGLGTRSHRRASHRRSRLLRPMSHRRRREM